MTHLIALSLALSISSQGLAMDQTEQRIEVEVHETKSLGYLIAVPEGYDAQGEAVPLLLFLHGKGERGNNLNKVKAHGPPKMIERGRDFGAIVLSPQCPGESWWTDELDLLVALLDKIEDDYNIDPDRIYVTGLSMGGFGTFALAGKQPERFAAAVPICAGGTFRQAKELSHLPMWVFHGDADKTIPVAESIRMVNIINQADGENAKLTIYPGVAHNSWDRAYSDEAMWDWLFAQTRSD